MVLATKGGIAPPDAVRLQPGGAAAACEASLRRLGVDVIDLYQIHRPDLLTHPADVAATLAALRDEGKIREVGVSNHTPAQVDALQAHLPFPLVSNQPEYSAVHLDPLRDGTFDACMRDGVVPLVWSPLAGGRLATGDGVRPELLAVLDGLAEREGVDRGDRRPGLRPRPPVARRWRSSARSDPSASPPSLAALAGRARSRSTSTRSSKPPKESPLP